MTLRPKTSPERVKLNRHLWQASARAPYQRWDVPNGAFKSMAVGSLARALEDSLLVLNGAVGVSTVQAHSEVDF